jgi:putative transposase
MCNEGAAARLREGAFGFCQARGGLAQGLRSARLGTQDRHRAQHAAETAIESQAVQEVWIAGTKKDAQAAFDVFVEIWGVKYDRPEREALLAF